METYPFRTLPDYLAPGLRLVFVGLNPGLYSAEHGHYFARPTNRFWPAFSRSRLSAEVRAALGRERLRPEDDVALLPFGIGFTDVVKLPTRNAADLRPVHFQEWAPRLLARLERYRPRMACFHGVTAYGNFARHALGEARGGHQLGEQPGRLGETHLYVVPSPSPANAHFTLADQLAWYDRLEELLQALDGRETNRRVSAVAPDMPPRLSPHRCGTTPKWVDGGVSPDNASPESWADQRGGE